MVEVLTLRAMTDEEARLLRELARSRTTEARLRDRARMCWLASQGQRVSAIKAELGIADGIVRLWIRRFNALGLEGLRDRRRDGRPPTYTPDQVGALLTASLTDPDELGLPFGSWTLDRVAAYLHETKGITMQRSRIGESLVAEGVRWRHQETWFGERPDPVFAEKRGPSFPSPPAHPRTAS